MQQNYAQTDEDKYVRDEDSKAILNTDFKGLLRHKAQKEHFRKMKNLISEVEEVKNDLVEIKNLLKTIAKQ